VGRFFSGGGEITSCASIGCGETRRSGKVDLPLARGPGTGSLVGRPFSSLLSTLEEKTLDFASSFSHGILAQLFP